jgi:hypothetical protein
MLLFFGLQLKGYLPFIGDKNINLSLPGRLASLEVKALLGNVGKASKWSTVEHEHLLNNKRVSGNITKLRDNLLGKCSRGARPVHQPHLAGQSSMLPLCMNKRGATMTIHLKMHNECLQDF